MWVESLHWLNYSADSADKNIQHPKSQILQWTLEFTGRRWRSTGTSELRSRADPLINTSRPQHREYWPPTKKEEERPGMQSQLRSCEQRRGIKKLPPLKTSIEALRRVAQEGSCMSPSCLRESRQPPSCVEPGEIRLPYRATVKKFWATAWWTVEFLSPTAMNYLFSETGENHVKKCTRCSCTTR